MGEDQKTVKNALMVEIESLKKALGKTPGDMRLHVRLGDLLRKSGDTQAAKRHFETATLNDPALVDAWLKLGHMLLRECNFPGSLAHYAMAQAYLPRDMIRLWVAMMAPPMARSRAHIDLYRRRTERGLEAFSQTKLSIEDPSDLAAMLFYQSYYGLADRHLNEKLAQIHLKACPPLNYTAPHAANPGRRGTNERIRIAFISRFFFEHSIGRLMRGVIKNLNRARFHVTLVILPHVEDAVTKEMAASADDVLRAPLKLDEARTAIAAERFDLIVYPEIGMDSFTYCLAFARLAPVQCVSWGHPVSTGIPNLDYFVSAEDMETAAADGHYSETLFRLKTLPTCYYKPKRAKKPKSRADFGLPADTHVYFFAQYLFKMHPDFDHIVGEILRKDPQGILLFVQHPEKSWKAVLMARLKESIPDVVGRVKFAPFMPHADFLELLACVDACLDPPTFSGGNTTFEALSVGTPVVSMPGELMRGRVCAAICRQIGFMECIASSAEEYVALAVRLGCDSQFQKEMRAKILKNNHALFDDESPVREWERFFQEALADKGIHPPE